MIKQLSFLFILCAILTQSDRTSISDSSEENECPARTSIDVSGISPSFSLTKLENIYVLSDGFYVSAFVVGRKEVVVIDAPPSMGGLIGTVISQVTDLPVTHFIYSHGHADHVAGATEFAGDDIEFVCHVGALESLESMTVSRGIPPCTIPVHSSSYLFKLPGIRLKLDHHGTVHSKGDFFVYSKLNCFLMVVDLVSPGWAPFAHFIVTIDMQKFLEGMYIALDAYEYRHLVGGHIQSIGDKENVQTQLELTLDYLESAEWAAENIVTADAFNDCCAGEIPFDGVNNYRITANLVNLRKEACADRMVDHHGWSDERLTGFESFVLENCFTAIIHRLIH